MVDKGVELIYLFTVRKTHCTARLGCVEWRETIELCGYCEGGLVWNVEIKSKKCICQ